MIKWKKLSPCFYFVVVIFLIFSSDSWSTDEPVTLTSSSSASSQTEVVDDTQSPPISAQNSPRSQGEQEKKPEDPEAFAKRIQVTEATRDRKFGVTFREVSTGIVAAGAAALSALPFTTLCSVGFDFIGIPLPDEGTGAYYFCMSLLGTPPCLAVARASYFGANWVYGKVAATCCSQKEENNEEESNTDSENETDAESQRPVRQNRSSDISWREELRRSWLSLALKPKIYSIPTACVETAFWGGFYLTFIRKAEAVIYQDDPAQGEFYGWVFGGASVFFSSVVFVFSNQNPNEHPFRQLRTKDRKYVDKLTMVQDIIREARSFCYCSEVPNDLKKLEENWADYSSQGSLEGKLEEVIKSYKGESGFDSYDESWQHRFTVLSSWVSLPWGAGAYPIKPLIAYFLLKAFFAGCGVSGDALWNTSVALSVPASLILILGTLKRQSSLQKECNRLLDGFYKSDTPSSWGAALLARWCGLSTIGFPTTFYLKREVLDYWQDNPGLQYAFIALFVAEATAAASLFYEEQFVGYAHWFDKGASFYNRCTGKKIKLLPCWSDQETVVRLGEKLNSTKRIWDVSREEDDLKFWGNSRLTRGAEETPLIAVDNL